MGHTCNPSTGEAETGRSLELSRQASLVSLVSSQTVRNSVSREGGVEREGERGRERGKKKRKGREVASLQTMVLLCFVCLQVELRRPGLEGVRSVVIF